MLYPDPWSLRSRSEHREGRPRIIYRSQSWEQSRDYVPSIIWWNEEVCLRNVSFYQFYNEKEDYILFFAMFSSQLKTSKKKVAPFHFILISFDDKRKCFIRCYYQTEDTKTNTKATDVGDVWGWHELWRNEQGRMFPPPCSRGGPGGWPDRWLARSSSQELLTPVTSPEKSTVSSKPLTSGVSCVI